MKQFICIALSACIGFTSTAQNDALTLDDNKFLIGKKVVAKVKDVKLGFLQGRELRLLGSNDEFLLAMPTKTLTIGTPPKYIYINYASIFIPALNDSIQMGIASLEADGMKIGFTSPDDEAWADYLFRKKIVNEDGTLNIENVKALKNLYPTGFVKDYEQKAAIARQCAKEVTTPVYHNPFIKAKVTEVSRQTTGNTVLIKYKVEHDTTVLGEITATGNVINLTNERAEVDFKSKIFYKKSDMETQPMSFEIVNNNGCRVAAYSPMSKVLSTVRADRGGTHGIMKPILDGKADSVKTRLEVIGAIADYLIGLGYY